MRTLIHKRTSALVSSVALLALVAAIVAPVAQKASAAASSGDQSVETFVSADGANFVKNLTGTQAVNPGQTVTVRIAYDNRGAKAVPNVSIWGSMSTLVSFISGTTKNCITPSASEKVCNTDAGQAGAIPESVVWGTDGNANAIVISPTAGLYDINPGTRRGILEMGKKRYLNFQDCDYILHSNGVDGWNSDDILGFNPHNTAGTLTCGAGSAGTRLRPEVSVFQAVDLMGKRYGNFQDCDYILNNGINTDDLFGFNPHNTAGTFTCGQGPAGVNGFSLRPQHSLFTTLDHLGLRYLNFQNCDYQLNNGENTDDLVGFNPGNTAGSFTCGQGIAGINGYTLRPNHSFFAPLDLLDQNRGKGYIEYQVKAPSTPGTYAVNGAMDIAGQAPFGDAAYFEVKTQSSGVSVYCNPIPQAPGNASGLDSYGKAVYDVALACRVTATPGRFVVIGYPQKYEGRDWRNGDTLPYSWGYLTYSAVNWACQELAYRGIHCDPIQTLPNNNNAPANAIDVSFRAIGQCGSLANVAAKDFATKAEAQAGANAGWNASWSNYYVQFPACPLPTTPGVSSSSASSVSSISSWQYSSASSATAQCTDGIDNDNDGAFDQNDFSCSGSNDNDETNPRSQCQDGLDNDGDGRVDMNDPGCSNQQDNDEFNASSASSQSSSAIGNCADGRDNEGDGRIDANDSDCHTDGNANNPNSYVPTNSETTFNQGSSSSSSRGNRDDDDLDVTVSASATEAFPGASVEYTVTVENDTGDDLRDLVITASFDEDDFRVTDDGDADEEDDGELVFEIGDLDDGDEEEIEFTLRIDSGVNPGSTVNVEAEARASDGTSNDDDVDVRVIGTLPQTGGRSLGGGTAYLTKTNGGESSAGLPMAAIISLAISGIGAGGFFGRKLFF